WDVLVPVERVAKQVDSRVASVPAASILLIDSSNSGSATPGLDSAKFQGTFALILLRLFSCRKKVCKEFPVRSQIHARHDHSYAPVPVNGSWDVQVRILPGPWLIFAYPVKEPISVLQYSLILSHCPAMCSLLTGFYLHNPISPALLYMF